MSVSSLQSKTVRPTRFGYSYYASSRRPVPKTRPARRSHALRRWTLLAVVVVAALIFVPIVRGQSSPADTTVTSTPPKTAPTATEPASKVPAKAPAATPAAVNECAGNTASQLILVSISQRHLWACQGTKSLYDSPVVTGIAYLAADKTPTGTFRIYSKTTDTYLKGHDSTGSWDDYVNYWMPFLANQYGTYGLHDATWRSNSDFGNISPNSSDASHGCVELPLATAQWLYNWASVGTPVTIQN